MTKQDWLLLIIDAMGENPASPMEIQKALFLLGKNLNDQDRQCDNFYEFRAGDLGPEYIEIYEHTRVLESEKMIFIHFTLNGYSEFEIRVKGHKKASQLQLLLSEKTNKYIEDVIKWLRSTPYSLVIASILNNFPEMGAKAIFRN